MKTLSFEERAAVIRVSPLNLKLQCLKCEHPCYPTYAQWDASGPPCQPFSPAGLKRKLDDDRVEVAQKWFS